MLKSRLLKILIHLVLLFLIGLNALKYSDFALAIGRNTPAPRYGHKMVYDLKNNQTILFGGRGNFFDNFKTTWLYSSQLQVWVQISNQISPCPRIGHGMIYNSNLEKVFLFGGMDNTQQYTRLNDMWEFSIKNNSWTQIESNVRPSARSDHAMYFDPFFNAIVLFGGLQSDASLLDFKTWIYNCSTNNWHSISTETYPLIKYGHEIIYDEELKVGVYFGGRNIGLKSETWFFNLSSLTWVKEQPTIRPSERYWFDMVYNPYEMNFVLFGGDSEQSSIRALGDTWIFDSNFMSWSNIDTNVTPPPRNNHAMVFDLHLNKTLLFGGGYEIGNTKILGDFWSYDSKSKTWNIISFSKSNFRWLTFGSFGGIIIIAGIIISLVFIRKKSKKK